jgi:hypothetical protein
MPSEEMVHISPMEVAPKLGKGAQDTWRLPRLSGGRLDKTGVSRGQFRRGETEGKPRMAGAYTDRRLNLSKLWEGPRRKCQGFKPDPGNPAVRDYRGASGNVSHGGNVHPSCNRKSGKRKPPTYSGARPISIPIKTRKPTDNLPRGEAATYRLVTTVNANVASKNGLNRGPSPQPRAKAAWVAET